MKECMDVKHGLKYTKINIFLFEILYFCRRL
jgi:hypothetical protein